MKKWIAKAWLAGMVLAYFGLLVWGMAKTSDVPWWEPALVLAIVVAVIGGTLWAIFTIESKP